MTEARRKDLISTLKMIADDAERDAKDFDGQPFNGKTVGTYFGNHGASLAALAKILSVILTEEKRQ